jgi:hypothetical protein
MVVTGYCRPLLPETSVQALSRLCPDPSRLVSPLDIEAQAAPCVVTHASPKLNRILMEKAKGQPSFSEGWP